MAYSDYGAVVHCDGKPVPEACDVSFGDYLKLEKPLEDWDVYHGILGDRESGFVVCLYKQRLSSIWDVRGNIPVELELAFEVEEGEIDLGIAKIVMWRSDDDYIQHVEYTDILGRFWTGSSGSQYGNGFDAWYKGANI